VLEYDDFRHILKTDTRPLAVRKGDTENIRINTFGGHSVHAFQTKAGTIDLLAWGALQTGRWGTQKQLSNAIDFEGGFQPSILPKLKPWVRGGFYNGSGDGNPNDNKHETFFQVLPTPRPFAKFPFFNMMNNRDEFGMLILRPHAKITTSSEFHALALSNANDFWYTGGGAYQPWTFGYTGRSTSGRQSLANLYDTNVEYRFNRKFTFTGYFGYAQGLAAMEQIYPKGKDGKFGYVEMLYKF
jgi:Alginate export